MNKTTETSLFTDLNQSEASTIQGGYFGRRCHRVTPIYYVVPCSSGYSAPSAGGSGVTQNVNINIED